LAQRECLSLLGQVLDELVEDVHDCRDARPSTWRGSLRTRSGALAAPRSALGTPGGSRRRPSRPLPMPRRPVAFRRRLLVARRRDFAGLPRCRLALRELLVRARDPPRAPRRHLAASRGSLPTSSRSLVRPSGPPCTSRRPLVAPRRPVPPPRRSPGARRGYGPIPTRHLRTVADRHAESRSPEGPHRFHSGVLRFAHDDSSVLRVATAYFTRSETIWLQSPPPVMVSTWTRK
jgi:hypothetical protein